MYMYILIYFDNIPQVFCILA